MRHTRAIRSWSDSPHRITSENFARHPDGSREPPKLWADRARQRPSRTTPQKGDVLGTPERLKDKSGF